MLRTLYTKVSRFVPMDITRLLLWNLEDTVPYVSDKEITVTVLSEALLAENLEDPNYELNLSILKSIDNIHVICIGAYVGGVLAAYLFFCDSPVAADKNSGGAKFTGIGLEFSANTRYLYKVLVLPEFRGRKLSKYLMNFAADKFRTESIEHLVTTTEWTNTAFYSAARSVGFKSVAYAGEAVIFGKSYHWLPSDVVLGVKRENAVCLRVPDAVI